MVTGHFQFPVSNCLVALVAQLLHCDQSLLGAGALGSGAPAPSAITAVASTGSHPWLCPTSPSSVATGDCTEHARWG